MWRYSLNLRSLYETPTAAGKREVTNEDRDKVAGIIADARRSGRTILTEYEAKRILAAYHIPTTETFVAKSAAEAATFAAKFNGPAVVKLHSETLTHKTDVGGVKLNLSGAEAVEKAFAAIRDSVKEKAGAEHFHGVCVQPMIKADGYELILGSSIDPQFGPVLLFGSGGQLVEVFKDRTLGLPPLNATLARRMLEQTKIYTALKGVRGRKAVDLPALEHLLVRFSQLVVEQPWIAELDINPLLASPDGLIALDARVILHAGDTPEERLPVPAIRSYPTQYVSKIKLHDGTTATLRPIKPEDEPLLAAFHHTVSERSVQSRFQKSLRLDERIAHDRLTRICFNDYNREIALVVEHRANRKQEPEIIAVGRLSRRHGRNEADLSLLVSDVWQRRGLGTMLIKRLVQVAKDEKLDRVSLRTQGDNAAMEKIGERLGFSGARDGQTGELMLELAPA
jgi:acetyltransferase